VVRIFLLYAGAESIIILRTTRSDQ
jgi:hypothetical protein